MNNRDERVLILMPTIRDGERTARLLNEDGLSCAVIHDMDELCQELNAGAGVALLTEEVVEKNDRLKSVLASQPPWSDFPLVVLAREGRDGQSLRESMNITLVERPVKMRSLLSVVRAALRSRRHQYEVRNHLAEKERFATTHGFLVRLSDALRGRIPQLSTSRL